MFKRERVETLVLLTVVYFLGWVILRTTLGDGNLVPHKILAGFLWLLSPVMVPVALLAMLIWGVIYLASLLF